MKLRLEVNAEGKNNGLVNLIVKETVRDKSPACVCSVKGVVNLWSRVYEGFRLPLF